MELEKNIIDVAIEIMKEELDSLIQTNYIKTVLSEDTNKDLMSLGDEDKVSHDAEFTQIVSLLIDIRFQLDIHLIKSPVEIQKYFDENIRNTEHNYRLRAILDLTNKLFARLLSGYWQKLIDHLTVVFTLHSSVSVDYTCYDPMIYTNMGKQDLIKMLDHNPWLVTVCVIKLMQPTDIIKYLDVDSFINGETP